MIILVSELPGMMTISYPGRSETNKKPMIILVSELPGMMTISYPGRSETNKKPLCCDDFDHPNHPGLMQKPAFGT